MNCNECHEPMTELDPREITDPQPSRFIPRWRCDEQECPAQGEVVEDDGKEGETAVPDFTAHISGDDERVAAWLHVFDGAAVPLRSPIPHLARLPGRGQELVYSLDIEALTADQRGRLVAHIAATAAAKLIAVQEAQIEALKAETAAYAAVLVGVCELYELWDFVDPVTGEVSSGKSKRPS